MKHPGNQNPALVERPEKLRFTVPGGTLSFFAGMREPEEGKEAYYCLTVDLNQMGIMETRLRAAGFPVVRSKSGTYPGFREQDLEEYKAALKYLYACQIEGWWGQREKMVEHGICTGEEFQSRLEDYCKNHR